MKTIIFLLTLFTLISTQAASVTLVHDANTDTVTKGYFVYTLQNGAQVFKTDVLLSTTNTVNNLLNSTTYNYYVTAYDVNKKESLPSNIITNTTPAIAIPIAPVISSVKTTKNGLNWDIDVNWGAVSGATSYSAQILNSANVVIFTVNSSNLTAKFTGITSGQYTFIVKAINSSGSSPASTPFGPVINISTVTNVRVINSLP